ncbi:MAG: dephospho-CoA kinase [Chitinophagales bacterium]
MLKVGITGGIGSGKTTVCNIFKSIGVPVYNADKRAKTLMETDEALIGKIKGLFGNNIYNDKNLNRKQLAEIVFNDAEKLKALNALVHPAVGKDALHWQEKMEKAGHPYTLKEAALLFETGSYKALDKIIVVDAPEKLRIQRVMKRDTVSEKEVRARMDKQWPQTHKNELADFIIHNDGENTLIPQVRELHKQFIEMAKR